MTAKTTGNRQQMEGPPFSVFRFPAFTRGQTKSPLQKGGRLLE
jgi:hypothetical protein